MQYCQLLTAELETMSLQGMDIKQQKLAALQVETSQKGVKGQGKGGKQGSGPPNPLNELGVCRFFASQEGVGMDVAACTLMVLCLLLITSASIVEQRVIPCLSVTDQR